MKCVKTICRMCPYGYCGMNVYVENGKIVKVEGMPEHPANKGGLCAKGLAAIQFEYDPKRLKHPMKRVGERGAGKWQRISWDEALDAIATKLMEIKKTYGAQAVAYHRGTGPGWRTSSMLHVRRFLNVFGSPNLVNHNNLCHTPRLIAYAYTSGEMPAPDYENTKCMILWGYNPASTSVQDVARRIIDAKERGAKLIVIDPRFSEIASKADVYVQPRPGTDGALALGMLNLIIKEGLYDEEFVNKWTVGFEAMREFIKDYPPERVEEITWVPANLTREVARTYATIKPAILQEGNGVDQHTNVVQTVRAFAILRAITGNLGIVGGHLFRNFRDKKPDMVLSEKMPKDVKSVSKHPLFYNVPFYMSQVSPPELIDAIISDDPYSIKALIVQGGSFGAVASNSNRVVDALKKLDLLVVHDIFMTAEAEVADIALPAATFLEQTILCGTVGGAGFPCVAPCRISLVNKVVEPLGECWPDMKFIFELSERVGCGEYFPWKTVEEAFEEELAPLGLTLEKLKDRPEGVVVKPATEDLNKWYEKDGFKTLTGKVEIYSKTFELAGYDPLPSYKEPEESPVSRPDIAKIYPLICGTGLKPNLYTHTQFRTLPWLNEIMPEPFVEVHPQRAEELGIDDEDMVFVESLRGKIKVRAKLTEAVAPGVVMIAHGWGQPYAHGAKTNILTDDSARCPISAATGNRSFLCKVKKA